MAKRRREGDSVGTTAAEAAEELPVFVETSVETRLVVLVSESENVSDFKRKIASEHKKCFPQIGEMEVHSLKVRRRGSFYHLTDAMHVWNAFQGVRGSWFLYADASRTSLCCEKEKQLELGASGVMEIDERDTANHHKDFPTLTLSLEDRDTEKEIVNDRLLIEPGDNLIEDFTATESPVKKKCKLSHGEDVVPSLTLEDNSGVVVPGSDKVEVLVFDALEAAEVMLNLDQREKSPVAEVTTEKSSMRNDQSYNDNGDLFDQTTARAEAVKVDSQSTQNLSGSDPNEGMVMGNSSEKVVVSENLVGELIEVPQIAGKTTIDDESVDINSGGIKKKKKKSHKSASKTHDAPVAEETIGQDDSNIRGTATRATATFTDQEKKEKSIQHKDDEQEEETELSELVDKVFMSSQIKASVLTDSETVLNQPKCYEPMLESNVVLEPESVNQKRRRSKGGKKHVATNLENCGVEQADNIMSDSAVSEKIITNTVHDEPEVNVPIKQSQECEVLSTRGQVVYSGSRTGEINFDRDRKKKKKKSIKKDPQVQDKSVEEEQGSKAAGDGAGIVSLTPEEKEGHGDFSQSHNYELVKAPQLKITSDSTQKEISPNEESCFQQIPESNNVAEQDTSVTSQKKKKTRKKTVGASAVEKTDASIRVSSSLLESDKGGFAVQKDDVNGVSLVKNGPNFNRTEDGDSLEVALTQPEKYLRDISIEKQQMGEKTEISAIESSQGKGDTENTQNKDKKGKKKRAKKVMPVSSDVQADIFNNHLQVISVPSSTEPNSRNQAQSEQEKGHDASSQDLPPESEGTHVEMQGAIANTDGSQEPVENVGGGIEFKNYFVPSESKDNAVDVEKTAKPNKEKTRKKVKKQDLPSVGNTPELQGLDKPLDNQKGEDGSRVRKRSQSKHGDAIKRPSVTSGNEAKTPSPAADVMDTETPKKPRNVSPHTIREKEEGHNNSRSDRKGATTKSSAKMSQEKSLLSKSGSIFQDMSGDSCADDNGTVHPDARAGSASDSSTSDSSDGESNLSPKAGSIRGRRSGPTPTMKLSNASEGFTIDTLLRRSKRFKDAKMIAASQNEDEEMEFVPESQA